MRLRFTPSGRLQFLRAVAYIRRDDHQAALKFRRRAERVLRGLLRRYSRSGRLIPEFPDLPFREVIVPPYRFFYRVAGKEIWIVAVWHGAQLPRKPRARRPKR